MTFEIVDKVNSDKIQELLRDNKYLLNDYYKKKIDIDSYIQNEVNSYINNDSMIVKYILKDNKLQGLYSLERLDWDSKIFGKNMWKMKLVINSNISEKVYQFRGELMKECKRYKIEHISCQVRSKDYISAQFLESIGFKVTDCIVRFGTSLEKVEKDDGHKVSSPILIRNYDNSDYEELLELAEEAFTNYPNRFLNDNTFNQKQCDRMYMEWIKNSTKGFADLILVAEKGNKIVGFSTIKDKKHLLHQNILISERQLSGVSKASRGMGINTRLLMKQLSLASEYSSFFEVGTQVYNYTSQKTYYKCGLRPFDSYFSFHLNI